MDKIKPKIPKKITAEWQRIIDSVIESSINSIAVTDINGTLTYVNNSFLKMWRYDDDQEVLGRRFVEFWQVKESVLKVMGALREKDSWAGDLTARRKDGSTFDVHLSLNIVKDEADKSAGITATIYDITKRRKVEEALHESENKYRRFMESLSDGCFVLDRNWRYIFVNEAAAQLVKYNVSELLGNKITKLFPGIEDTLFFRAYQDTMDTGKTNDIEAPSPRPDGTPGYLNIRVSAVPEGIIVVARDVTEHRQAEERLRLLSSVVEQSSEGIAVADLKGNFLFVNNAFAAMHGYTREESIGKHLSIFHTPEQMPAVEASLRQIKETGEFSGELWHVRRDGKVFPTQMQNSLLRDLAGNPIGFIGTLRDITDLRQAEEALRTSEERWRSALENAPNVILIADREGTIQFINRTISGYTIKETIGTKVYDYVTPEYHSLMKSTIKQVFESGEPGKYESGIKLSDGSIAWYETQIGPVKQDDQIVAMALITTDLTERKRMEEALREGEENYRLLVESAAEAISVFDGDGRILFMNRAAVELLGGEPQDFIGKTLWDIFPQDVADERMAVINEVFRSGKGQTSEFSAPIKGVMHYFIASRQPIRDSSGKIRSVLILTTDITERKRAEEALRQSEDRYRSLFDAAPVGIGIADLEGNVIASNLAMMEITGFTVEEFKNINIRDIYADPRDRELLLGALQEHGKVRDFETKFKRKDGTTYFVLMNVDIQELAGKKVLFTTVRDITELKLAEAELLQAQKQRLVAVGQLAAGVAHEINNPLMALSGEIQLLLGTSKDKELVESLDLMNKLSKRIADIVTDLIAVSREISIDVKKLSDINSLIERTLSLMKGRLESKKIEIKKKLDKNLPDLVIDKGQIQQVFTNMLMNSSDAMPDGGKLTISTKLSRARDAVEITFVDTGSGIAKENLPKIFDPFFTTKPPGKGVGMGLSVSYRIIENHGGSIKIKSELDKGTKVLIKLPVKVGNA